MKLNSLLTLITIAAISAVQVEARSTQPTTSPTTQPTTQPTDLSESKPGDRVWLPDLDAPNTPRFPLNIQVDPDAPTLILSDKPEYFRTGNGIALQETLAPGNYRFYPYHVPTPKSKNKVITAVIENKGDQPLTVRFTLDTFVKPGGDYQNIAKIGLRELLRHQLSTGDHATFVARQLIVPVGETVVFDPRMDAAVVKENDLIHGIYAFSTDQPAVLSVFQKDVGQDSIKIVEELEKLPRTLPGFHASGAGRGLFPQASRVVETSEAYDAAVGARQVVVADGVDDAWIVGTDGISGANPDGTPWVNKGNYGMTYRIKIAYTGAKPFALLVVNDRAKAKWCEWNANVIGIDGEPVEVPIDRVRFGGLPEAVFLGRFAGNADGSIKFIQLDYSPAGAACLPTPFWLVPLD